MREIHVLGAIAVTDDGDEVAIGGPQQRRVLTALVVHRNAVVSVDRLADIVFAGEPKAAAATTLRSYIARVRKVLGGPDSGCRVLTRAPGYVLELPDDALDAARFERGLSDATERLAREDPLEAAALLRRALALWRGGAFAEFSDEDWARPEAQRLEELRLVAEERLVDAELACGKAAELIPSLEAMVADHPLREGFWTHLIVANYRAGRQADALRAYQEHRRILAEELGLEPTATMQELERRILDHDPELAQVLPTGLPLRGYRLGERLGSGPQGTVHAAQLPGVERDLVIRSIPAAIADDPDFVRDFDAMAQRVASLRHPVVVPIHDHWREPGAAYVVLRRLHGGSLADRMTRGPLNRAEVTALVTRIGGALAAAADAGVVHGQVDAGNVLYDGAGAPCLTDFSLVPTRPSPTPADDVTAFVKLLRDGLGPATDAVHAVLDATALRPVPMSRLVVDLSAALVGDERAVAPVNPYKGLRAFDEADADDYFGRTGLVADLTRRLAGGDRLVLVVGGSGTGKSSVVRAGLLPRLRRGEVPGADDWFISTMLPGAQPFHALGEALRQVAVVDADDLVDELAATVEGVDAVVRRLVPVDGQMLLVVDQFEELFTAATDADQRAFLAGLVHALSAPDSRLRVVATLRADFYDRPLAVRGFASLVNEATVTMPAMTPAELEAVVVEPAERVGRDVERSLVAELVAAVVDQPAALPALQFTLYELAEVCGPILTLGAYREIGEVDGAIAARAEALYRSLDDEERALVRRLFEQLVLVDADEEPTRRRAPRPDLTGVPVDTAVDTTIDRWAAARLLSLDRHPQSRVPTVEVAHEALLREWPRLRRWLDDDRDALLVLGHLREAATTWAELDRDVGALYRGAQLEAALHVANSRDDPLPTLEEAFLAASREQRDADERDAHATLARQARANRRLRLQLGVIAVALLIALVGGIVAVDQRGRAEREGRTATARELAAAADANLDEDPERSILLALAAIEATGGADGTALPEAVGALHAAVARSRVVLNVPGLGGALDWSPDGRWFVTEGPEESGMVDLRDATTGESVRSWPGHEVDVNDVAFAPDGRTLATTGDDGALILWDISTGTERWHHRVEGETEVWGPAFSPDGTRVAASWQRSGVVRVFDTGSGRVVAELDAPDAVGVAFTGDGRGVVAGDLGQPVATVFDIASGAVRFRLEAERARWVRDVAVSPDGGFIATSGADGAVRFWDGATGAYRFSDDGHAEGVNGLVWTRDGGRLASVADDGTARVVEVTEDGAREVLALSAQDTANGLQSVAVSPDGTRIMTGDWGMASVKVWDISPTGGAEWLNLAPVPTTEGATAMDFLPDGRGLAVANYDGGASVWDVESGRRVSRVVAPSGEGPLEQIAVSPDGSLVAASRDQGTAGLWSTATGEQVAEAAGIGAEEFVVGLSWSPDGEHLALAVDRDDGGRTVVVDLDGNEVAVLDEAPGAYVRSVSFSGDGRRLAVPVVTERNDPDLAGVTIWDWRAAERERTIRTQALDAAFDPSGDRVVSIGQLEGVTDVWDAGTGDNVASLPGTAALGDVAFADDGSQVATAAADGAVRLWDPTTGIEQLELRGHTSGLHAVAFSPDRTRLASVGADGVLRVWALDLDALIAQARDHLTRTLDDAECRQYLHVEDCSAA